jgi:uncharacterized membrane protein YvbJ
LPLLIDVLRISTAHLIFVLIFLFCFQSKVVTSRSNSTHDFEEALKEAEAKRAEEAVTPTAPPTTQITPSENQ